MTTGTIRVRPAAVAGAFYPADPNQLATLVRQCFAAARPPAPDAPVPHALVVPHAGLVYSGPIAASAYLRLVPARDRIRRVVLLGPSHRVPLRGLAVSSADVFTSPFGRVAIDAEARRAALALPYVHVDDSAHALEHSLEVQLPFLQAVLDDFALLPLVVGDCAPEEVAAVIDLFSRDPHTVIVVSTDLSHYLSYDTARQVDQSTADAVTALADNDIGDRDACGAYALRGLVRAVRNAEGSIELLDLRNSGDTAGDRQRVVGYGAFAVC